MLEPRPSAMLQNALSINIFKKLSTPWELEPKRLQTVWTKAGALLWLCRGLDNLFRAEFVQWASNAGITCISWMSPEATSATMRTDAKIRRVNLENNTSGWRNWRAPRCHQWVENPVSNAEELGAKRGISHSEVSQPVVWSCSSTCLPWYILPFHGRSDRNVAQAWQAHPRGLLSHSELPFKGESKAEGANAIKKEQGS
jgi:hypothetical protein